MGEHRVQSVTRRTALALLGSTMLVGSARGGVVAQTSPGQQARTVRGYVGSYHWGYFLLDESGREIDQLSLSVGDELRLTAFNVEADEAIEDLPDAVRAGIPSSDERSRRNDQSIPAPQGVDLEELHEAAELSYPDHSLAVLRDETLVRSPGGGPGPGGHFPGQGPWGGHHGGVGGSGGGMPSGPYWGNTVTGLLAPPTYLWHHSTVPAEVGFRVETSGSFGFACTVYCGYGHPYMAERDRIVVNDR